MTGPLYMEGYSDGQASAMACRKTILRMSSQQEKALLAGRCLQSEELIVGIFRGGDIRYKTGFFDGFLDKAQEFNKDDDN